MPIGQPFPLRGKATRRRCGALRYGHPGDLPAGKAALADLAQHTPLSAREMGEQMYRAPAQRALFLEGVAKIEGGEPS